MRIYLFCLMQNHFHLVLETPRGNLGRYIVESGSTGVRGQTVNCNYGKMRAAGRIFGHHIPVAGSISKRCCRSGGIILREV